MIRRWRTNLGFLLGAVLLAALLSATSAQAATGAITGTVTSPEGAPLRELRVNLYEFDTSSSAWTITDSRETGPGGTYSFAVPAGTYRVGFQTAIRWAPEFAYDARTVETADDIVVGEDETEVVDAQLGYGGIIEGRATDSYGEGIGTLDVIAYEIIDGDWVRVEDVETNSTGHYRMTGLESGTYRLRARNRSAFAETFYKNATTIEDADDVQVTFGETTSGIDFQPPEQGRFSGLVTDTDGVPLGGVGVGLYESMDGEWAVVNRTVTRANGTYRLHAPHTGVYRIWFGDSPFQSEDLYVEEFYDDSATIEGANDVSVVEHQETAGVDASLATNPDPDPEPTTPPEEPEPTDPPPGQKTGLAKLIDGIVNLLRSLLQR